MNEILFTFDEACHSMGVTPAKLERLIEEGTITVVDDGIRRHVTRETVLAYMARVSAGRIRAQRAERTGRGREAAPATEG
jgi:excisionase family DNA binding protein